MPNQTKVYEVENLKAEFEGAKSAALIDYQGLTAEQVRQLRRDINEKGGEMKVAKNTLTKIALEKMGVKLDSPLEGPTAIVYGIEDEISPLKAVDQTRKQFEKPVFKLGILGNKLISLDQLESLIKLPNKDVLLAMFVGGLASPISKLAGGLKNVQTKFVLTLKALAESKEQN